MTLVMIPTVRAIPVVIVRTTSPPAASAADRNRYYRRVPYRARREESPTERTEKRSVTRQPGPGTKSGIPKPTATAVAAVTVAIPIAIRGRRPGGLIAYARVVLRANIAPGVEFIFLLAIELLGLQQVAEDHFTAPAEVQFLVSKVDLRFAIDYRHARSIVGIEAIEPFLFDQDRRSVVENRNAAILDDLIDFDHRFAALQFQLSIDERR